MTKQRDWIDYGLVASNLVQNVQLHGLQEKLGQIKAIEEHRNHHDLLKEARELRQEAALQQENALRESVFQGQEVLEALQYNVRSDPGAVSVLACEALRTFEVNNVTTASFTAYEDKQRLSSLLAGLHDVQSEAADLLTPEKLNAVQQCVRYRAEMDDLLSYIQLRRIEEGSSSPQDQLYGKRLDLKRRTAEREELSKRVTTRICIAFAFTVLGGLGLFLALVGHGDYHLSAWFMLPPLTFSFGSLIAVVAIQNSEAAKRRSEVEAETVSLESECAELEAVAEKHSRRTSELGSVFGSNLCEVDLLEMQRHRNGLIIEIFPVEQTSETG